MSDAAEFVLTDIAVKHMPGAERVLESAPSEEEETP